LSQWCSNLSGLRVRSVDLLTGKIKSTILKHPPVANCTNDQLPRYLLFFVVQYILPVSPRFLNPLSASKVKKGLNNLFIREEAMNFAS
jgi:hypothetical protein